MFICEYTKYQASILSSNGHHPGHMLHPANPDTIDVPPQPTSIELPSDRKNVLHFVALPDGVVTIDQPVFPEKPLIEYPFELDEFQRDAIACVHNRESVLVSAHTSAGKTAIALYAIKAALSQGSRVVYTSPIKALSNQKYRELKEQFDDVGLITGDVTTNASASCLVMTTEILRMMLYRASPLVREISWVIYDEIHYMKDVERGVVWEESIVLLPHDVRFVFLSATIPNAREFSEWIAHIHHQPCHVVYTEYRPVPLEFMLAPPGKDPIVAVGRDGSWHEEAFSIAFAETDAAPTEGGSRRLYHGVAVQQMRGTVRMNRFQKAEKRTMDREEQGRLTKDVAIRLMEKDLGPMIIFCFGRKECSELSELFGAKSFVSSDDSDAIDHMVDLAIEKLSESDKELPQIAQLRDLLKRGIGIHHGGLIPLMKELIEVLFQHGYVKILIATETFAMGLNMPARTVLFHSLLKFDGIEKRLLMGSEFIQMSGRAGRRNNDTFGAVVITASKEVDEAEVKSLLKGDAQPLNSEFHITYHMILSLLSAPQMTPEELMRLSFHQFQMERELPTLKEEADGVYKKATAITVPDEKRVSTLMNINEQIDHCKDAIKEIVRRPDNIGTLLRTGRVVKVGDGWGWGIIVAGQGKKSSDVLVALRATVDPVTKKRVPSSDLQKSSAFFYSVDLDDIEVIAPLVLDGGSGDQVSPPAIKEMFRKLEKLIAENGQPGSISERSMVTEGKNEYEQMSQRLESLHAMRESLGEIPATSIDLCRQKKELMDKYTALRTKIRSLKEVVKQQDMRHMRRVLEKLNMVTPEGVVQEKGRVASVITAGDELVMTEMLYDAVLKDLTPQQIAALMTVFACDEGSKETPIIPDDLTEKWEATKTIIERIVSISKECGIDMKLDDYMKSFDPTYMMLTYNWAGGADFSQLMEDNPQFFEGSVIRTIKRTEEVLRQASRAAKEMGESALELAILEAITVIKRDIVFAASLYL